jgi:hypothetical protein
VQIESGLAERWSASIAQLCEELPTMNDADPSVRLHIAPDGDALILQVALVDGRSASRRVRTPEELAFTVEALTALPLTPSAAAASREAPAAESPTAHVLANPPASDPKPSAVPAVVSPAPLSVELGVLATGRVARAPTYLSPGFAGFAGVRIRDWLMELTLRWDLLQVMVGQTPPPDFEMESLGAGFSVGKRAFAAPGLGLDVGGSALLLAEKQSFAHHGVASAPEVSDVEPDIRVGLFSRLSLGQSAWHWAVSLDAEVSPLRLRRARRIEPDAPTLPTWSVGLGLGAAWSDR